MYVLGLLIHFSWGLGVFEVVIILLAILELLILNDI